MRIKQKIVGNSILRIYQEDVTDDMLEKYMDMNEDIVFQVMDIIAPQKKDIMIQKILKDKDKEGIKTVFKQDFRNWMVRTIMDYGFAKIREQGYIVDKIIVSPIVKMIIKSIEDEDRNRIMSKNRFWTAEVKVEEKTKDILFLSSYFEEKKKQEYQVYI